MTTAAMAITASTDTRSCNNCGTGFRPRTANQRCCSAKCRRDYQARLRAIRNQQPKPKRRCNWCREMFEAKRTDHDHCSEKCRHAFNNFAKSWGPRLVKAMLGWRYFGRRLNISDLCQTARDMYADLKNRRPKGE